jgi:hypothetical protein
MGGERMKKVLRNAIVIALLAILSVTIVYAVYKTTHTHYPSWTVESAIEVQYPIGTAVSTGSSINWGVVYVGTNSRDYRVISRSDVSISVDISLERAPSNYALTHNVTAPFTLAHNGDFIDIRFYLIVNSTYGQSNNNCTIQFTITG